jgi:glycosyltransferase involved in cell wall biosynthesis
MRASIIINTLNRCESLRKTLRTLFFQSYKNFEVIVVNGPSDDGTAVLLEEYAGKLRALHIEEANLSASRNVGIDAACGEIIVFVDDDCLLPPIWLERLIGAYEDDSVDGAGGPVLESSGFTWQVYFQTISRLCGIASENNPAMSKKFVAVGADPFQHMLGGNFSIKRSVLVDICGFDENYTYFLDESDVCMRAIDAGFKLRFVPDAHVLHKFQTNSIRNEKKVLLDPYNVIRSGIYFTLKNNEKKPLNNLELGIRNFIQKMRISGKDMYTQRLMTSEQLSHYLVRIDEGIAAGKIAATGSRLTRMIAPANRNKFLPFPTVKPTNTSLCLVFASFDYPPIKFGGNGRHTRDLAKSLSERGHEVHVITLAQERSPNVDFENDVWVHRVALDNLPGLEEHPLHTALSFAMIVYREALRIHEWRPVSLLQAPLWMGCGALVACDSKFPTVASLMTNHMTLQDINPTFGGHDYLDAMLPFERLSLHKQSACYAISDAIREKVRMDYGLPQYTFTLPLCIREHVQTKSHNDSSVRLLFVGRIEPRKAVDILLCAAAKALPACKSLEIHLVGQIVCGEKFDPLGEFEKKYANFEWRKRIIVWGEVNDEKLQQIYASSDIVCLPSRYESFGLVLVEGMIHSLPLIASRVGGMPEVADDTCCLFFENEDSEGLAKNIQRLANNPSLRRQMGMAARQRYEKNFSPEVVTRRLEQEYAFIRKAFVAEYAKEPAAVAREFSNILVQCPGIKETQALQTAIYMASYDMARQKDFFIDQQAHTRTLLWNALKKVRAFCSVHFPWLLPFAMRFQPALRKLAIRLSRS